MVELNTQSKPTGRLSQFGSIILLLVGWCLLETPVGMHIALWSLDVPSAEHQRSGLRYTLPCVVLGSLLIWVASRLRSRWHIALGITALVMGVVMFGEGCRIFNDGEVIKDARYRVALSTGMMTTSALGALAGMALIIRQKLVDRTTAVKAGPA